MNEKGFTLIETLLVISLIAIISIGALMGLRLVDEARFNSKVCEVVHEIECAKQAAVLTGGQYSVISFDHHIFVTHNGYQERKIELSDQMRIPYDITGHLIHFNHSIAPKRAGTIVIMNENLGKQARITVGVGTGMVRVYFEPC